MRTRQKRSTSLNIAAGAPPSREPVLSRPAIGRLAMHVSSYLLPGRPISCSTRRSKLASCKTQKRSSLSCTCPCPCFTSVRPHPICGLEQSTARKTGRNRLEVRTAYRQRGGVFPLQLGVQLFWEPLGRCCRLSRNGPTARRQSSICSPASTRQNPFEHTVHPDEETGWALCTARPGWAHRE